MADDKLFPYQARVPVTADGALPSVDLLQFLNKLFKVVGGIRRPQVTSLRRTSKA